MMLEDCLYIDARLDTASRCDLGVILLADHEEQR
jgi:hypothetical protein